MEYQPQLELSYENYSLINEALNLKDEELFRFMERDYNHRLAVMESSKIYLQKYRYDPRIVERLSEEGQFMALTILNREKPIYEVYLDQARRIAQEKGYLHTAEVLDRLKKLNQRPLTLESMGKDMVQAIASKDREAYGILSQTSHTMNDYLLPIRDEVMIKNMINKQFRDRYFTYAKLEIVDKIKRDMDMDYDSDTILYSRQDNRYYAKICYEFQPLNKISINNIIRNTHPHYFDKVFKTVKFVWGKANLIHLKFNAVKTDIKIGNMEVWRWNMPPGMYKIAYFVNILVPPGENPRNINQDTRGEYVFMSNFDSRYDRFDVVWYVPTEIADQIEQTAIVQDLQPLNPPKRPYDPQLYYD